MPKEHKFVGYRKYDRTATLGEQQYTEGIDYYGGDTQVYITDVSKKDAKPIRIACLHSATGGRIFYDMRETTCYGQLHKGWMQTLQDSDPIQLTISALSADIIDTVMGALDTKRVLRMMVLLPDSRYIDGLVRVESVDFNTAIDAVFEYIFTFRRVYPPAKGKDLYTVEYDLRGGNWKSGEKPDVMPYYFKDQKFILTDKIPEPPTGYKFAGWTAYNRTTHETITIKDESGTKSITVTANSVIQVTYTIGEGELIHKTNGEMANTIGNETKKESARFGAMPDTRERYPIGTLINLPPKPDLKIDKHWEIVGWIIDGKPYEFGEQYQIMGDTIIEDRWQEMTIVEFSAGTNPAGVVPEPLRVAKGDLITVPQLAYDPNGMFRAVAWKDEARNVTYQPERVIKLDKDMTLTATWKPLHYAKYSVDRTDVSEGTLPTDPTAYEAGDLIPLPPLAYITREGYNFAGWERGSGDTRIYQPGEVYTVKSSDGAEIIFDATWEEL